MQTTLQFYKYINFLTGLPKPNSIDKNPLKLH